jgi:predicted aspartyl protease
MSVNVQYDQSGWQIHHRMGNGLVAQREYQYMIQDTSNQNVIQWKGYNQKIPQMYMIGEIQRVPQTGAPFYHEWLYVNGALTMESGTYCREQIAALTPTAPVQPMVPTQSRDSVPITTFANGKGVSIPVGVGKYTITMMLDTGASSMLLSKDVADALVRDGSAHSIGTSKFQMADGRVVEEPMIVVNEVRIGNHILHNVEASVMPGNDMLLGFTVVNQIGPFKINTRTNELVFGS